MATTTNYGWTTPDDTALVKDGAAAIRSLGTSIDTTTKNLNPSTTLGDIEYRSSTANTNTRLGIGTTGQVLTVSGGVPSWAAPASGGGITLLSTTTLSGISTSITGISQDYRNLYIIINNVYVNTADTLTIEINSVSGNDRGILINNTTIGTTGGDIRPSSNLNTTSNPTDCNMVLEIFDYTNTSFGKPFEFYGGYSSTKLFWSAGVHQRTSATDSIRFYTTNGTATFTAGTVKIYGVE